MAVHLFDCTDGFHFVLDRVGQNTRSRQDLHVAACLVANRMMRALPPDADWSNWIVSVQNRKGRMVDVIPFPVEARAGSAPRSRLRPARPMCCGSAKAATILWWKRRDSKASTRENPPE